REQIRPAARRREEKRQALARLLIVVLDLFEVGVDDVIGLALIGGGIVAGRGTVTALGGVDGLTDFHGDLSQRRRGGLDPLDVVGRDGFLGSLDRLFNVFLDRSHTGVGPVVGEFLLGRVDEG